MQPFLRGAAVSAAVALALFLAGCVGQPRYADAQRYPAPQAPAAQAQVDPQGTRYGVVVGIEGMRGAAGGTSGAGAVIGGVAGGVLGHQIGQGGGRALATIAGVVAGALVGNAIEGQGSRGAGQYHVAIRFDDGAQQVYAVPAVGDLRQGDRVRVYQGQISRL